MKKNINKILIIFMVMVLTNIILIKAENDTCPAQEPINCDNFKWVENYIKNSTVNVTPGAENLINILKNTNYNLQDDLNKCSDTITKMSLRLEQESGYKYAAYICFFLSVILTIILAIVLRSYYKK